jgi:uncharacterized alpha-E superfamily protein
MPRSLRHCATEIYSMLNRILGNKGHEALRKAGDLNARLEFGRMDEIIAGGLHEYLTDFLDRTGELGAEIHQEFFASTEPEMRLA